MIKIYHNSRCQKSRLGVKFLEKNKLDFEIINYINDPLSMDEIKFLLKKLKIKPIELIRKNELLWNDGRYFSPIQRSYSSNNSAH